MPNLMSSYIGSLNINEIVFVMCLPVVLKGFVLCVIVVVDYLCLEYYFWKVRGGTVG